MHRLTVFEREGAWRFLSPAGENEVQHHSALEAANAARNYGETLRGQALGYVIRLQIPYLADSDLGVSIFTQLF